MMPRSRSRILSLGMGAFLLGAVLVAGATALETWQRIAKGGFAAGYTPFQYVPNTLCVFKDKLYTATGGEWGPGDGQVWQYDGSRWAVVMKPDPSAAHRILAVTAMATLGDYLYAAAYTYGGGCEVWRTRGTGAIPYTWVKVSGPRNLGLKGTYEIPVLIAAGKKLYAGTYGSQGGRIWCYDGTAWTAVVGQGPSSSPTGPGFGNKENTAIRSLAVSPSGSLLAGTGRNKGCEVWRETASGWSRMNVPGFGAKRGNTSVRVLAYFGSSLYAMTENSQSGCQVQKYLGPGPEDWKSVHVGGFGDPKNDMIWSAAEFGTPTRLYLTVHNYLTGLRIIRTDGKTWQAVSAPGFGRGARLTIPGGLAVYDGNLYAAAGGDAGISIFATAGGSKVPFTWKLKNEPGFSTNNNFDASAAAFFRGALYVGTSNGRGGEVWRRASGAWKRVATGGFGNADNYAVTALASDGSFLYAGTLNWQRGCEVWRYNGTTWTKISKNGFGDSRTSEVIAMAVFGGRVVVGTSSYDTLGKVWRFDGPGPANWTKMNVNGFGVSHTVAVTALVVFDDQLYAGTYDSNDPCRVWRYDGPGPADWTAVSPEGVSEKSVHAVYHLAVYKGGLYAGLWNAQMTGAEIWKYSGSGLTWTRASKNGFGDRKNSSTASMLVHNGFLYVGTSNVQTGGEIWAYDGHEWTQVNKNGFDITFNARISALASDGTSLFAGTANTEKGCEVWTNGPAGAGRVE